MRSCPLSQVHCWLVPPLQVHSSTMVPLAPVWPEDSKHKLVLLESLMVPSVPSNQAWLALRALEAVASTAAAPLAGVVPEASITFPARPEMVVAGLLGALRAVSVSVWFAETSLLPLVLPVLFTQFRNGLVWALLPRLSTRPL